MGYFKEEDYAQNYRSLEIKIKNLQEWIWGKNVSSKQIKDWIENFSGEFSGDSGREKLSSLHILSQYMFFDQVEIRAMLRSMYRDLFYKPLLQKIKKEAKEANVYSIKDIQNKYKSCLHKTRFSGIGNNSESSSLLLYFFRQELEFPKEMFIDTCSIYNFDSEGNNIGLRKTKKDENIEHYIFIDDISASGEQACEFFKDSIRYHLIKKYNPSATIYYFTLFNTPESRRLFQIHLPDIKFKTVFELDDTYKVFSDTSRYFPPLKNDKKKSLHTEERNFVQEMCKFYLKIERCGYKNSQLLLGFFYNTPDNTIDIMWSCENWTPVFKRYNKSYKL